MCPCLSSKSKYAICCCFREGLMVPSLFERENYCFSLYELCPIFSSEVKDDHICIKEEDYLLIGSGV